MDQVSIVFQWKTLKMHVKINKYEITTLVYRADCKVNDIFVCKFVYEIVYELVHLFILLIKFCHTQVFTDTYS